MLVFIFIGDMHGLQKLLDVTQTVPTVLPFALVSRCLRNRPADRDRGFYGSVGPQTAAAVVEGIELPTLWQCTH